MIEKATKRETLPSPLGVLLPITIQALSPILYLTFFKKLQNCVNERNGHICIVYTRIAVNVGTVVLCIVVYS